MIDDEFILNNFFVGKHKTYTRTPEIKLTDDVKQYLDNRFSDISNSYKEIIFRIKLHIEQLPKCPVCGKDIHLDNHNHYRDHCSQYCSRHDINVLKKDEQTREIKYGNKHFVNKEKRFKTNLERYGDFCPVRSKDVKDKMYNTKLKKYGNGYFCNQEKSENTCLEKYGAKTPLHLKEVHQKSKQTCINKYGVEKPLQNDLFKEKFKETCLKRYGVEHHMKSNIIKEKFNWNEINKKANKTKHKNHSFKISRKEQESFLLIKEKYTDVDYQYRSELYPFYCDFYIPSLDLYIECNYHWTHGGKPYEGTEDDNKILQGWKNKNTSYYNNAINCWTIRDVNKRNIAKENKLNWIEFWNIEELKLWLNHYGNSSN